MMNQTQTNVSLFAPDLTRRAPRSLRCRLGGYALLPRLLDKCRASIVGTQGEYHFNCPLDRQFLDFVQVPADSLRAEVAAGKTDSEVLAWIQKNALIRRQSWEISAWSEFQERRTAQSDPDTSTFFASTLAGISKVRTDIISWADLLDLDDHVSFGGTA